MKGSTEAIVKATKPPKREQTRSQVQQSTSKPSTRAPTDVSASSRMSALRDLKRLLDEHLIIQCLSEILVSSPSELYLTTPNSPVLRNSVTRTAILSCAAFT